jgi:TolB-like protein/tetratricopeptide (TPR) repeat protein
MVVLIGVIFTPLAGLWSRLRGRRAASRQEEIGISNLKANPIPERSPVAVAPTSSPVLAVLPFDNLSVDSALDFFSEGMSDDIIQTISRGLPLDVIARTSSFQFRGARKAEAGKALACSHILDGSIRRAADQVRVNAQLMDAVSGVTLWSDRFDGTLTDIFKVQDQIATQIGMRLRLTFNSLRLAAPPPAMYDLFLQSILKSYAPAELRQNVTRLEAVTQGAPDFAAAWGRLAYVRAFASFYQPYASRPSVVAQIERDAARALALDPKNPDALWGLLLALPPCGAFREMYALLERVRVLPRSADGSRYIGWSLRNFGLIKEALKETEASYVLDPLDAMSSNMVALARMAAGHIDDAIPLFENLITTNPDMSFPVSSLLRAFTYKADWAGVDRVLAIAGERQLREFEEGLRFIRGRRDPTSANIDAWMDRVRERAQSSGSIDLTTLAYSANLGRVEEAYELANACSLAPTGSANDILGPDAYRPALMFQAGLPELRRDIRFVSLCGRLGLARFWQQSGIWPDCVDEVPYDFRRACSAAIELETPWRYPVDDQN